MIGLKNSGEKDGAFKFVWSKKDQWPLHTFMEEALAEKYDEEKQRGFYVDLDTRRQVASSPADVTKADAERWLQHADNIVTLVKGILTIPERQQ